MKCHKCHSHMQITDSQSTKGCVQIRYKCPVCEGSRLSSRPVNRHADIQNTLAQLVKLNTDHMPGRGMILNGAPTF